MVVKILTELGIPFKKTLFRKAPKTTYAVYHEPFTRRGGDNINLIKAFEYSIELYSYAPDPQTEKDLEDLFDKYGIEYEKQECFWIESEQLYQVIYDFEYITKEDI